MVLPFFSPSHCPLVVFYTVCACSVFIASFSCDKYGRKLRIFLKSSEPRKETDDVYQKGLRIVILFCGKDTT